MKRISAQLGELQPPLPPTLMLHHDISSYHIKALQVFESLADCLPSNLWSLYALPYLRNIATRVKQKLGDDAVPMVSTHNIYLYP